MLDQGTDLRIQRMRAEIERSGETLLEPAEVTLLSGNDSLEDQKWRAITEIAINEGWSFTFLPDDSIRFAKL